MFILLFQAKRLQKLLANVILFPESRFSSGRVAAVVFMYQRNPMASSAAFDRRQRYLSKSCIMKIPAFDLTFLPAGGFLCMASCNTILQGRIS